MYKKERVWKSNEQTFSFNERKNEQAHIPCAPILLNNDTHNG